MSSADREDLAILTDEERALALELEEEEQGMIPPDEADDAVEAATKPDEPVDDDSEDEGGEDEADEPEPKPEPAEARAPAPIPQADPLSEAETERLKAIEDERHKLIDKFDAGDVEKADFAKQLKALDTEHRDLERKQERYDAAEQAAAEQFRADWQRDTVAWAKQHPEIGNLMRADASDAEKALFAKFDAQVRHCTAHWDEIAPDADNMAILNLALAQFNALNPGAIEAPAPKKEAAKPKAEAKPAAKKAEPKPEKREIPKTLAHVPAAAVSDNDEVGSRFAAIDRLLEVNPEAAERAIAKLPAEAREQFLAMR